MRLKLTLIQRMKLGIALFLTAILSSVMAAESTYTTDIPDTFLWKIEQEGKSASYLLGTVHIGQKNDTLSKEITDVLSNVKQLVIEANPTEEEVMKLGFTMITPEGGLFKLIGNERAEKFKTLITKTLEGTGVKIPEEMYDMYRPWAAYLALMPLMIPESYAPDYGIEALLKASVEKNSIPILTLESTEDGINLFKNLPEKHVVEGLIASLDRFDEGKNESLELIQLYQNNEAQKLYEKYNDRERALEGLPEESHDFWWNWFSQDVTVKRNHAWMPNLINAIKNQSALVAVGAGHLYGEEGLLQLLQDKGYTLTPVIAE